MIQPLVFLTGKTKCLQYKYFKCQRISQGSLVTHPNPIHYASRPMQTYSYEDQTLSFTDNTHTHKREPWPKWSNGLVLCSDGPNFTYSDSYKIESWFQFLYPWTDDKTLQVYQKKPIQTSMTILYMYFKPFVGLNFYWLLKKWLNCLICETTQN